MCSCMLTCDHAVTIVMSVEHVSFITRTFTALSSRWDALMGLASLELATSSTFIETICFTWVCLLFYSLDKIALIFLYTGVKIQSILYFLVLTLLVIIL